MLVLLYMGPKWAQHGQTPNIEMSYLTHKMGFLLIIIKYFCNGPLRVPYGHMHKGLIIWVSYGYQMGKPIWACPDLAHKGPIYACLLGTFDMISLHSCHPGDAFYTSHASYQ